jgi:type IV secretion system protein VirB4
MLSLEQKYGGFTFIFDIGGSYESVVELYGGKIVKGGVKVDQWGGVKGSHW